MPSISHLNKQPQIVIEKMYSDADDEGVTTCTDYSVGPFKIETWWFSHGQQQVDISAGRVVPSTMAVRAGHDDAFISLDLHPEAAESNDALTGYLSIETAKALIVDLQNEIDKHEAASA